MIRTHLCYSKAADKCLAQGLIGENPCLSALFFVCLMCIEVFGQFHNFSALDRKYLVMKALGSLVFGLF